MKKLRDAGDTRLHTLCFAVQRMKDGIAKETGWTAAPIEIPAVSQATR